MSNMDYCRFENTTKDLQDCLDALGEAGSVENLQEESNQYEKPYIKELVRICGEIHEGFGEHNES